MSDTPKILIVGDDPLICDSLEHLLTAQGYKTEIRKKGREALECIARNAFNLVLLDIGLPDMHGFQIMAHIHRHSPDSLVIMITGDGTIESAVEALKGGIYNYLRKPFQSAELLKTVRNALNHKRLRDKHRQSEKAFRESEERFRTLVENSLTGICIIQNNRIIYQNPEQKKLYGRLPEKPLNKLIGYVHPDDVEKVIGSYRSLLSGKTRSVETDFRSYPSGKRSRDTEVRWIQCRATLSLYQGEEAILVNMMDITRAKELEQILRVKSKMISLGRVAAGIAHEIRNPLTGINSYLYTLEDLLDQEILAPESLQMMRRIVEQLQDASNKIESVIKRVLDFSRPGAPSMTLINLNQSLEEAISLSAVSLRKKAIKIEKSLDQNLPQCYGDAHLIGQVILNLIDNAIKAIEKQDASKIIVLRTYSNNKNIYMQISDSGPGVPLGIRDKIFDPFFTTQTGGSGIGLAISQRIVNDHNGSIRVDSNEWGGAKFTIELPIEKRRNRK